MDFSIILMLIVAAACAIGLVTLSNRQAKSKPPASEVVPDIPEPGLKPESGAKNNEAESEEIAQPPEVTPGPELIAIYAFDGKKNPRVCPWCDGENAGDTRSCKICGQVLS